MALTDPRKRPLGGTAGPSPGAAASAPTSGASPAPAAQTARAAGTGFVNLSDILAANRTGAQQMGQALTQQVGQQGAQVQQDITNASNTFQNAVRAGTPTYSQPTSYAGTQAGAGKGYSGPTTWADAGITSAQTDGLVTQANEAQDAAQALGTQGGRAALLRERSPGLTAGGASLDAFLAGAGGGPALQQTAQRYANLSDVLAQARGGAPAAVAEAERQASATQQRYRDQETQWIAEEAQRQANPAPDVDDIRRQRRGPRRRGED